MIKLIERYNLLTKDFWLFHLGQFVSLLGDSASMLALSWYLLDKTKNVSLVANVVLINTVLRLTLAPLLGPLGDRYSRKKLILLGQGLSIIASLILFLVIYKEHFYVPLLTFLFACQAVAKVIFSVGASSMIIKLVPSKDYSKAVRYSVIATGASTMVAGAFAGIVISLGGYKTAFFVDFLSFIWAFLMTSLIRSNTNPTIDPTTSRSSSSTVTTSKLQQHFQDLKLGMIIVIRSKLLRYLIGSLFFIQLAFSPLVVALPSYIKLVRNLPAWYLGSLESVLSVGVILASLALGLVQKRTRPEYLIVVALALMGLGIVGVTLPFFYLPFVAYFIAGVFRTFASILVDARLPLAFPDNVRTRVLTITVSLCGLAHPLGLFIVGRIGNDISPEVFMWFSGGLIILLSPIFYFSSPLRKFFQTPEHELINLTKHDLLLESNSNENNQPINTNNLQQILGEGRN